MEFQKTQLGRILEDVKRVMLAHIPIVYIPTAQVEIIQELLYGKNCIDSLVPRVCFKDGETVKLAATEIGETDGLTGTFKSIVDKPFWMDLPMRYQPYTRFHEKLVRMFLK